MSKVVLGFSGGVDSAVSAVLLQKAGFEVHGLYMDNTSAEARQEAAASAERMGVELTVVDVHDKLEERVCRAFTDCYLRGETPNPCILCNPTLKFPTLLAEADRIGAELVATGHYARAENGALYKGRPANDQSYMLCRLKREQVGRLTLPLGGFEKTQVRKLAEEFGLPAAHKKDSMEICFIPDKDYVGWIRRRAALPGPGDFVFHGAVIGQHDGIVNWTVGQRIPGLYEGRKLYVSGIDAAANVIELALWEELFKTEVIAGDFNWLIDPPVEKPITASVRVRHTKWEEPPCTVTAEGKCARILCEAPVRAPAPGQSAVLYQGERLIGGGFILGNYLGQLC
ncbi:MAG: tRNA 2-thiouridine(34) synthase MnmA [Oscillospiraceae bacterium]|nr:tRNA 2-thiouridine(34) synthase MnmA [Oscillospiraceae bacterium]MBQ6927435.1 tRNA 2-thiouridine(34) synthase MnmA [Oscillospiraceae bacterium]